MFAALTREENTELYLVINRSSRRLSKHHGMLIELGAFDAGSTIGEMNNEAVRLLEDLNHALGLS